MKKLLRTLLIIILFVWVGFVYVIKNPSASVSQKILTTLGIDMTNKNTPASTGIDLTNCVSYFDGCNNCTVKDGKVEACTLMYCETPAEPKCNEYANTGADLSNCTSYFDGCNRCSMKDGKPEACTEMYCETPSQAKCLTYGSWSWTTSLANPASVNCETKWWNLNIVSSSDGSQVGMCTLNDGTVCEERAYMRGECWTDSKWAGVSPGNPWSAGWSEPTACTMEYAPVCASVAVQCIKAPCPPIQQTFWNRCTMNANKLAKFIHNGECAK